MAVQRRGASRRQVAEVAGVSPATVSLVLNGRGDEARVAKSTQARVREVAERLRYIPHSAARAVAGRRYLTLGIIARRPPDSLHVPIFEDFMVGAIDEAARYGHNVKFLPPVSEPDSYDVSTAFRDAHVDAVLVQNLAPVARSLADWSVPVVYVGLGEEATNLPLRRVGAVTVDECEGLRAAARHLRSRGHRHAAVLAGPNHNPGPMPRLAAFATAFRGKGTKASVRSYEVSEWSASAGYRAMHDLLADRTDVTAVHVGNDRMAIGAMAAVHEAGLSIPDDLELIGFGDFPGAEYLRPPLTTVRWPLDELARQAVNKLIAQLDERRGGRGHTQLPADLVIRESSPVGNAEVERRRDRARGG